MIKSRTTYEISYPGFDKKPDALDTAIGSLLAAFGNDHEAVALFINDILHKKKLEKLESAMLETAEEMKKQGTYGSYVNPFQQINPISLGG